MPARTIPERHRLPETEAGEIGAMKAIASQRQSQMVIGRIDQPPETRTGRKNRNRLTKTTDSRSHKSNSKPSER
ncbi:hypothetical protein DY000_02027164 [Brassica cretica]|uniref:Uncharacterized protein n=1 Tax=Brassica cretica TaxID=69181 RepID=A0ABQ7E3D2_BRACR|nr:hypothetical protein DY000_02027164 [Brassica cretica]